jgi:hypothetical protein
MEVEIVVEVGIFSGVVTDRKHVDGDPPGEESRMVELSSGRSGGLLARIAKINSKEIFAP